MLSREDLHKYQNAAVSFVKKKRKCALFMDMGLGKTATTLTVISDFLDDFFIKKVLIIAPLRVANTVWKQEAEKWSHLKDLKISICTGTESERIAALKSGAEICVINRENVDWLVHKFKWPFDMVVIDESSGFKSPKSRRFKALKKVHQELTSIVELTGTPSPNGMIDLWSQIYLLDSGERLGRNMTIFKNKYFKKAGYMGYGVELIEGGESQIKTAIADICMTMKAEDYLDLPDRIDIYEYIDMPGPILKQYRELEKEFTIQIQSGNKETVDIIFGEQSIEALSGGALCNKLLQFCNGAVYDENKFAHEIHDLKLTRLKEIIEDNPDENFLVAYNFQSDLKRLTKAFPKAVVLSKSGAEIEAWNKGHIKMMLAHPASAGHGLNIQFGGSAIVWFGLNWSLELYQQFNARLHRQGQLKPVRIIHLVARKGMDERVLMALTSKAETQEDLLQYLKKTLH